MSEILTESFCERCGTRYTFESARPKKRLKGVRVLSLGLKNFVLSDETSLDEAMAAARSETDRELTSHQLDAFHKTFNFCMSCRQYTCPNCWNEVDARCLSCAPLPGLATLPASLPGLATRIGTTVEAEPWTNGGRRRRYDEVEPEPIADVIVAGPGVARPESAAAVEPVAEVLAASVLDLVEPEAAAAVEPVAEVITAAPDLVEPEAAAAAAVEPAIIEPREKAIGQTADLLRRFRPGQSLDEELAAYELQRAAAATQAAVEPAEPAALADDVVEPVAATVAGPPEPSETAPTLQAAPEPAAPEPAAPEPAAPEPAVPAAVADVVEQPTWRITAPPVEQPVARPPTPADLLHTLRAGGAPPPPAAPQWPARPATPAMPDWPPRSSVGSPFPGNPAGPRGAADALWAASNQELVGTPVPPGRPVSLIQPCVSCGLSLSATARFCRRCGTLQVG